MQDYIISDLTLTEKLKYFNGNKKRIPCNGNNVMASEPCFCFLVFLYKTQTHNIVICVLASVWVSYIIITVMHFLLLFFRVSCQSSKALKYLPESL